jgi:hypothetical protein
LRAHGPSERGRPKGGWILSGPKALRSPIVMGMTADANP